MKRVMGMVVGLLLCAGTARAHGAGHPCTGQAEPTAAPPSGGACCVPVQKQPAATPPVEIPQPLERTQVAPLPAEEWQGLAEYQMPTDGDGGWAPSYDSSAVVMVRGRMAVSGEITRVNPALGEVGIYSRGRAVTLHGTPAQIAKLKPGRVIQLPVANRGGALWLVTPPNPNP